MNRGLTSTAVMSRRLEPADSLDYFPTPPWATRGFCEHVLPRFEADLKAVDALDPACGEGHMAVVLGEYFDFCTASDIFGYGFGGVADFLHPDEKFAPRDWIITNPPFNLGAAFVKKALSVARRGAAMLVRTAFLEGAERQKLFAQHPPALIAQYVERVPMHRGRWVCSRQGSGGSSATAYAWIVWVKREIPNATQFSWIPACRRQLTRHDDYLNFSGCIDLPKTHPAVKLQGTKRPLTIAEVRQRAQARQPATLGDITKALGALL